MGTGKKILYWIVRIIPAVILLQTLFFKFTASEESVYIFTKMGMEPWGRIGTGITELIASVLLLIPATSWLGALLGTGLMTGAIGSHLTVLGIEVMGDGGLLFIYGWVVMICCIIILFINKSVIFEKISAIFR
jgi:uncharacterized membrane protein YphA (DoxX/SURF4 family)